MSPFQKPTYTPIPNELLGDRSEAGLMATLSSVQLRVLLAVCRVTFGFHRRQGGASLRQIQRMTGIANRRDIVRAAEALAVMGLTSRELDADGETVWSVLVAGEAEELVSHKPRRKAQAATTNKQEGPIVL